MLPVVYPCPCICLWLCRALSVALPAEASNSRASARSPVQDNLFLPQPCAPARSSDSHLSQFWSFITKNPSQDGYVFFFNSSRFKVLFYLLSLIYLFLQGPLPNTCCHFWLMVWQQKTKAVVMLNRVVEKESVKCAQYWPTKDDREMLFKETGFRVKLLSEDVKSYYTVYLLQLEDINSGETRTISHFHYTTWPDFGVPESPASFLNFLFKVRESGSLNPEHGPAVIHCSAGIGRSGTFSLVDTCLVLMEKGDDINIKQILLNMRKYRMGLIQTPDQLRFSYMAILEGAKFIKGDSNIQKRWKELSKEDLSPAFDLSPTKIMTEKYNGNRIVLEEEKLAGDRCTGLSSKGQDTVEENSESVLRKRIREDRKANTAQKVQQMKQRLNETERKRKRPRLTDT
ncbi:tyrosine-protein phosphatase non-receptor type 2 isoform X2 [Tamandua tetradactyla]|uniref:tyrosine-protein phosphatase non-receptor type 2 isoform X2 n=1 Tax=Tamandua tetradactyla TaxID=48850 RepID=UPI00405496FC